MRFHTSTDYAVRMTLCLAKSSNLLSSAELAKAIGVSSRYLLQIASKLKRAGLILSTYGPNGGLSLARPASEMSLYEIVIAMGDPAGKRMTSSFQCEEPLFFRLGMAYEHLDSTLEEIMRKITIERLLLVP